MVIGPAIPIGPEPTDTGAVVAVDWLMSTCVAYRRSALPAGVFNTRFTGYSPMEDVELSLRVARQSRLVVHTGARIFHDSQDSVFKRPYVRAKMTVQNRYYVMTTTLGRQSLGHHARFLMSIAVAHATALRHVRTVGDAGGWLLSLGGTASGLLSTAVGAMRHTSGATEARVGY
jgi:GT2 family glycosyltransferase